MPDELVLGRCNLRCLLYIHFLASSATYSIFLVMLV